MIIFLLFAVITAGLVLMFLTGIDFNSIQENLFTIFTGKNENQDYEKTNYLGLIKKIDTCWNNCSFGDKNIDCGTIYLTNEGLTNQDINNFGTNFILEKMQKLNFCESCVLDMNESIVPPTIIKITCQDNTIKLVN